jgi:hypothetical protein
MRTNSSELNVKVEVTRNIRQKDTSISKLLSKMTSREKETFTYSSKTNAKDLMK